MKVDGQCHCGSIAFEAEVEPGTINVCHCADCQRLTGSAFRANISAAAATFRIVRGEPARYVKTADSGARRVHAFCSSCGGPVYSAAESNPQSFSLRVGTLNQRHELGAPQRQIWVKRQFTWLATLAGVPKHEGQP